MQLYESLRIAFRALAANKMRSVLTMLGMIIGVGAVITLMSVGRGVEKYVTDQFSSAGSNLLFIVPGQLSGGPPERRASSSGVLTLKDAQDIANPLRVPDVIGVAPEVSGSAPVSRGKKSLRVSISGVTPAFQDVRSWKAQMGSFITDTDNQARSRVAVIGSAVYKKLFEPTDYPIDQTIRINNLIFRVIGVMEEKGGGGFGNRDETVFVPLTTAQDRLFRRKTVSGDYQVNVIYAAVNNADRMDAAQEQMAEILRENHNIAYLDEDDFSIINQADLINIFGDILGALTLFLGAIAGISLLVGGIGIMNIMLVSVTERTREIGLRKAVGAKRRDILGQFLIEAITLALVGGVIGIVLGTSGAEAISSLVDSFNAVVGVDAVLTSLFFSMGVGLFFGIYPAYQASRLNPIEALRYE